MSPDIEILLRDESWVRALAQQLVRDGAAADDLVQEAWLAARRHAPDERSEEGLRRWFGAVLRNRARADHRGEGRRRERERDSARHEAVPGPEELLERLELREKLVNAVRALDEPYRTAILLRWFEGALPREIAQRQGVSPRTVHSQLHRGLELLRAKLRAEFGSTWLVALVPLCDTPPASLVLPTTSIGILAMTAPLKWLVGTTVAVALFATYLSLPTESKNAAVRPEASLAAAPSAPSADRLTESSQAPELLAHSAKREVAAATAPASLPSTPEPVKAPLVIRGKLVTEANVPLANIELVYAPLATEGSVTFRTASDGTFEFAPGSIHGAGTVIVDPRWTLLLEPRFGVQTGNFRLQSGSQIDREFTLIAAPRLELAGVVVGPAGEPVSGARVALEFDFDMRAKLPHVLDHCDAVTRVTKTDAEGRFSLEDVPATRLGDLRVQSEGFEPLELELPEVSDWSMVIQLEAPSDDVRVLRGRVRDATDRGVAGAWISLDGEVTKTVSDGRFALELREPGASGVLWAVSEGRAPKMIARGGTSNLAPDAWPDPLEFILDGEPLAIRVRVLDAAGEPIQRASVRLIDPTPFGTVPFDEKEEFRVSTELESLASGRGFGAWEQRTDERGEVVIEGLFNREYRIGAIDPESFAHSIWALHPGPELIDLHLPAAPATRIVAGRVRHADGSPVADVEVTMHGTVGDDADRHLVFGKNTRTDAEGRFRFGGASSAATLLHTRGRDFDAQAHVELPAGDVEDIEVVLPRIAHVRIELADPGEATSCEFLDADGAQLQTVAQQGSVAFGSGRVHLTDGKSPALRIPDKAHEIVLYRANEEVRRARVRLTPGDLMTLVP